VVEPVDAQGNPTGPPIRGGTVPGDATLGAHGSSHQQYVFNLPDGIDGTGRFRVTVMTDSGHAIEEFNNNHQPAEDNNTSAPAFVTSTLANYPDLTVTDLAVSPDSGLQSGNLVTLTWNDSNVGDAAVGAGYADVAKAYRVNADGSRTLLDSRDVTVGPGLA